MGKDDLEFRIVATDDATKVLDSVAKKADKLEGSDVDVTVKAKDEATERLDAVMKRVDGLDKETATVILNAEESKAEAEIRKLSKLLADLDGEEATAVLEAKDNASKRLDAIQSKMREVEARSPVDVDVKPGPGFASLTGALDKLPGKAGEAGAALSGLGTGGATVAAGVAGIGAALAAAAFEAKDLALEVNNVAKFAGTTADEASRLLDVWKGSGADVGDLLDTIGQVNGVLAQTPGLADQLGISLKGANPQEVFLRAVDALNQVQDSQQKVILGSQLFGEQGTRQVAAVTAKFGDLRSAMKRVEGSRLVTDEDVARAQKLDATITDLKNAASNFAASVGEAVIPALSGLATAADLVLGPLDKLFGTLNQKAEEDSLLGGFITGVMGGAFAAIGKLMDDTEEKAAALAEADKKAAAQSAELTREAKRLSGAMGPLPGTAAEAARETEHMGVAAQDARNPVKSLTTAVEEHTIAYQKLKDGYSDRDAYRTAKAAFDDLTTAIHDSGAMSEETSAAFDRAKESTIDYVEGLDNIPPSVKTLIQTEVDQGSADHARAVLDALTRMQTVEIWFEPHLTSNKFKVVAAAEGSPGLPGGMTLVGERGPELIKLPTATQVFTAADTRRMMTGGGGVSSGAQVVNQTTIVNVPRGYRQLDAASAAHRVARRSGRLYVGRGV